MIITETTFEIEDLVDELVREIIKSDIFQDYLQAKKKLDASKTVKERKRIFLQAKEKFAHIERFQDFSKEAKEQRKNLYALKRTLDLTEEIAVFRQKELQLQQLLDEIGEKIAKSISEDILIEAGNPFYAGKRKHHCLSESK